MKRRMIPLFIMLVAGAITSIITYIKNYELVPMLWILLGVLVGFYVLGVIFVKVLDLFDAQIEEYKKAEEGAVIEKEMAVAEENIEQQLEEETQTEKQDESDSAEESAE